MASDPECLTCRYAPKIHSFVQDRDMCLACAVAAWKAHEDSAIQSGKTWDWRWIGHSTVHTESPAPEAG